MKRLREFTWPIWIGDSVALALVTLLGFATHGTIAGAGWRLLTTLLPLLAAWYFAAGPLGLLRLDIASDWRQLWRLTWAMALAGPLAALLRGLWLGTPIPPVFVLVLAGVGLAGMLLWRLLLLFWLRRQRGGLDG